MGKIIKIREVGELVLNKMSEEVDIININNDNKKNLLLSVAADIVSAIFKDSKNTKQNEVIIAKDANAFFDAI